MPPTALALVLTAALLHALWNIAAKKAGGNHHFALLSVLMTVVLWAPVALWFGVDEWQRWGLIEWAALGASALVHVLYFTVLLTGYRKADLTVVYPVARGSGPLLASVGAVLVLGETISLLGGVGILAVCGGVFLIAGGPHLFRGSGSDRSIGCLFLCCRIGYSGVSGGFGFGSCSCRFSGQSLNFCSCQRSLFCRLFMNHLSHTNGLWIVSVFHDRTAIECDQIIAWRSFQCRQIQHDFRLIGVQ